MSVQTSRTVATNKDSESSLGPGLQGIRKAESNEVAEHVKYSDNIS